MKTIISTVGTSIFENFKDKLCAMDDDFNSFYKCQKEYSFHFSDWKQHKEYIKTIRDKFNKKNYEKHHDISAEIASIISIQKELNEEVCIHLIATDTILSVLAAELIRDWFEKNAEKYPDIKEVKFKLPDNDNNIQNEGNHIVKDLRIDTQENYEKGVMGLLEVLDRIPINILNITGGYKAIVPILTLWAQIKKVPVKYLFNESELSGKISPLTLEPLPLNFDWEFIETVAYPLSEDVRLYLSKDEENDKKILDFLLKNNLINKENRNLTALGKIVQDYLTRDGQPTGNNILGLFVEYKLHEFFYQNELNETKYSPAKMAIYKNPDGSLTDQVTEYNKRDRICEIDILLTKPDGKVVIGEVKAYNQVGENVFTDLDKKANIFQKFDPDRTIDELWLIVVSANLKTSLGEWYSNKNNPKLKMIQNWKDQNDKNVKAFSYQFDMSTDKFSRGIAAINTKRFLQEPIKHIELIEL